MEVINFETPTREMPPKREVWPVPRESRLIAGHV
jgi:hypothetical protein